MSLPDAQRAKFLAWAADRWRADAYRHTSETSGEWDAWQAAHRYATKAVAAQAAELEAMRADAERYRFLRDKAWGKDGALALLPANEMDEAVDAARAALKEQTPNVRANRPDTAAQE